MSAKTPLVSIITSVYNSERYIDYCIRSVLNQDYQNFEFIIVDDCSQDKTAELISYYDDPRIRFIRNENNVGLTKNLNKAIQLSNGKYIARIDSDDMCVSTRLKIQVDYLESHPEIDVLGSNAYLVDLDNRIIGITNEVLSNDRIKNKLKIANPFIHPSIMMKTSYAKKHLYDEQYRTCQDFELWTRTSASSFFCSLKKPLIFYRINNAGATRSAKTNITKRIELLIDILMKNNYANNDYFTKDVLYYLLSILLLNKSCDKEKAWDVYRSLRCKDLNITYKHSLIRYFGLSFLLKRHCFGIIITGYFSYFFFLLKCFLARLSFVAKRKLLISLQ